MNEAEKVATWSDQRRSQNAAAGGSVSEFHRNFTPFSCLALPPMSCLDQRIRNNAVIERQH
jgi:hypothetical protein